MNQRPLTAAYDVMTGQELAAAAYTYADNKLESMRIKAAIPRKTYTMFDAEFVDAFDRILTIGLFWSGEYWRLRFLEMNVLYVRSKAEESGADKDERRYFEFLITTSQRINAHFEALNEVCENLGIDYRTVLERIGVPNDPNKEVGVDQKYKAELIETLLAIGWSG